MKTDSLASKAFTEIRRKILSNQLTPNTRLKEDEWAKKIGVSRMAVREALTRLLGEDLVVLGEKGGYYVKPLHASDVHQIRELDKICADFTTMVKSGYLNGALEADIKFHETLIEFSENDKLLKVYRSSHIPLFHQKLGEFQTGIDDYEQTDLEHRQIVKALKDRKLAVAEQIMSKHFARGEAAVLDLD